MAESLQEQIEKLRYSIDEFEIQRSVLGDAIVDPILAAARQKLAALEEQTMVEELAATQAAPSEERCLITILFIDMVGSTGMAEKLDPEEWRQVMVKLHTTLGKVISAHHGTVAQYLGDGLLAFFGAKETSEYDAENAIRAALEGQAAVSNLLSSEKVQLRAGIHSGLVVVGELGDTTHKEFTASGDAMNLAARLQSAAPPGGVLISHDTYRYVRGVFDITPRPHITVKGKREPLQTYLVQRAKQRPFRSVTRGVAGVETHTVGRVVEIQALQAAYLRSYHDHSVVWAQLLGEPGVGKSRLLADFCEWIDLREETSQLLRARAFPDDANQPFTMVRRMWFDRFQIADDTPLDQAEAKWVKCFEEFSRRDDCEEAAHALGLLVGLPFENSPYIRAMRNDPRQVKGRALVVSRELLQAIRQKFPLVVLMEDLQWTDAASWEYLMEVFLGDEARLSSERLPDGRPNSQSNGLFILGAARPEWHPPQELIELFSISLPVEKAIDSSGADKSESGKSGAGKWGVLISLSPLTNQATRELAKEIFQRAIDVPEQIIDLLVERSEGVPYYTEEIVNWLIDHGILQARSEPWRILPERLKEQPLPATLQHLLLTRLRNLSQIERAALQRGSIFGRRFWTSGVEALGVSKGNGTLGRLQPRGFVEMQPESAFQGDTEWIFHHHLLQEVTYESVLKRDRAALHRMAARWLERQARQARRLDEFAGLLGGHYMRAGELSVAADWYLRAGKRAYFQGAPREARDFYTQALELLLPDEWEQRWQVLHGRWEALIVLGNVESLKADTTALVELARRFEDDNFLAEASLCQGRTGIQSGDIAISDWASQEALEAARRCGNEAIESKALALKAEVSVNQGNKTATIQNIEEALRRARSLSDESVLSSVLIIGAYCYGGFGDIARCHELQIEAIELAHRSGDRSQEAIVLSNMGLNYLFVGLYKQAHPVIEQSSQICQAIGARRVLAYNLMHLGETYLATGDLHKARQLAEQGLKEIAMSADARGKIFLLNILGNMLLMEGDVYGADQRYTEGHEIALSQGLTPLAYESITGLAVCAVIRGQLDEARKYVNEAWEHIKEHGWVGINNPLWVYRNIAETFDALGEAETARKVIESGHQALMDIADTINISEWRESFLENVSDNREIKEMWERRKLL